MQTLIIEAQERVKAGTGSARAARREGMVPGIVYGDKKDPQMIVVNSKFLMREASHASFYSKLYTLVVNGQEQRVIAKEVQYHPVTDRPLHVDFMRINKDSKVHVFVPLVLENEDKAPAVKRGGVLNSVLHTLEIYCPADHIPQSIVIDVGILELHHSITLDDIKLPEGARAAHPQRDHVIVTVVAPSGTKEESSTQAVSS